jgi:hypothetical protein
MKYKKLEFLVPEDNAETVKKIVNILVREFKKNNMKELYEAHVKNATEELKTKEILLNEKQIKKIKKIEIAEKVVKELSLGIESKEGLMPALRSCFSYHLKNILTREETGKLINKKHSTVSTQIKRYLEYKHYEDYREADAIIQKTFEKYEIG